jgi:hypothetical protein
MWMPTADGAKVLKLDREELLQGETFCMVHPLCRSQKLKGKIPEAK